MSSFALFRPIRLLRRLPSYRAGLGLFVLSIVLSVLGPSPIALAAAHVPPTRTHIDSDVKSFHFFSSTEAAVLGNDGNLWLEHGPFGTVPPSRTRIDGDNGFGWFVTGFEAISDTEFLVLRDATLLDNVLWLEGPNGVTEIDRDVKGYHWLSDSEILVLGNDGNLWLEHAPFGNVPPGRVQVDGSVLNFQNIDGNTVVVLGQNENLWLEHAPFGHVPPAREQIDANVIALEALSTTLIGVKGDDNNLWLEQAPFG